MKTAIRNYLAIRRSRGTSPATIKQLAYQLKKFTEWLSDHHDVRSPQRLNAQHIRSYQKHLFNRRTAKGLPIKATSLNNAVTAVRVFLGYLYTADIFPTDLSSHIQFLKKPALLPTSVLRHEQVRKLISHIDSSSAIGYRNRLICELLYSTGIRSGELVRIIVDDIDLRESILKVHGKGNKERFVPIGRTAIRQLESYLKGIRPHFPKATGTRALFINHRGLPLSQDAVQRTFRKYRKHIFPDIHVTPHTLRRSCATELIRGDANIYHVKELLGHETLDTLKHYAKLNIADLKNMQRQYHPRERD